MVDTAMTMSDKQALLNQRQTEVSFTTSLFKAYKSSYNAGEEIELSIPPSRQMINPGDIQIMFRPVVQYDADGNLGLTQFQNAQRCLTAIQASTHLTINSITTNNHQWLAQPRQNTSFARTILESYMRTFVKTRPVENLSIDGIYLTANTMLQSGSGSNVYGVLEQQTQIPANGLFTRPLFTQGASRADDKGLITGNTDAGVTDKGQNSSLYEQDWRPKAVVSQIYSYFYPANINPSDDQTSFGTEYYEQGLSTALVGHHLGTQMPDSLEKLRFPELSRCITPSVSIYKRQQESWLSYRQRFIQTVVGSYADEEQKLNASAKTLVIDQRAGYVTIANGIKGVPLLTTSDAYPPTTVYATAEEEKKDKDAIVLQARRVKARFSYGIPTCQYNMKIQDQSRFKGLTWTTASSKMLNKEQLSTVSVRLGDLSEELTQCGLLCMEKTRLDISILVNSPECCLSAYLPPSLNLDSLNSYGNIAGAAIVAGVQESRDIEGYPEGYTRFLNACRIGSNIRLSLHDVILRVETHNYSQNAYNIVKDILYAPKPYMTFRTSQKVVQGSGPMSIPINLGVSTSVRCVLYWIVPRANEFLAGASQKRSLFPNQALPQDAIIDYQSCQVPQRGDLRSTILDSYYINHEAFVNIDNQRYNQTPIPLQDPEFSQYLLTSSSLQTAMNRYLDIDLQSFACGNRYMGCISIDPTGSRKYISQLLDFNININGSEREAHSAKFNHHGRSIANQFEVIVCAIVGQSLHECQRIVV